jgi:hypothetical protein
MGKRSFLLIGAALLAVGAMPAGPARGAAGTPCTFEYEAVASPGLSSSPSSGTVTSNGETGTITCNGPVNGKQPTGPGTYGLKDGRYGTKGSATCQSGGEGEGVIAFTIPTSSGAEHVTSHVTFTFGGLQNGLFSGRFEGDRMSGTFESTPQDGDCASRPVTKFHVKGDGTLNG